MIMDEKLKKKKNAAIWTDKEKINEKKISEKKERKVR